jgi:hypothetical protein
MVIRRSTMLDHAALRELATLEDRDLPEGSFVVAEIDGRIVAAAPVEASAAPLGDPFWPRRELCAFLQVQADRIRRSVTPATLATELRRAA